MANIKKHLENIKGALFGKDVRSSIHDGIDAINKEVEGTTEKQNKLGEQFKNLVINEGNSNAEVAASRGSHDWLPDRLDNFDSQLEHIQSNHLSISVKDFGAKGDGVTDDTEAIKKAFNSASDNHTTIVFPRGTYKVTDTLSIKDVKYLTITGDATISAQVYRIFNFRNCDHLTVSDLNIEGNSYCNKGLSIYDSKYSNVVNVKVQNMGSTTNDNIGGIELLGDCSFSTIRNCKVFNMISSHVAFGIMLSSSNDTYSKYCLIDNCLIDTVVPSDDADGIKFLQLGMQSYSTVSNCTILNCDKRAIKVQTEFVDIYNCYCEGKMTYAGIDFQCGQGTATDCTLKFTKQYYIGVAICGPNARLKNIKILNDTYDPNEMCSAIRISTLYSSNPDSLEDIVLDSIYCNNARHAIIWATSSIRHARSLKILNMTIENIMATYPFQFNGANVDFFQLENLHMLTKPDTMYNVISNLNFNDCIIRNNKVLNQRVLSEEHPSKSTHITYHEELGGTYYVPYIQQGNSLVYRWNKNPMEVGGSNGKVFTKSRVGDRCENTNTTIITYEDTSYIISEWICTANSDDTNVRGVWKEIRQYV